MRAFGLLVVGVVAILGSNVTTSAQPEPPAPVPTYTKDIAPFFKKYCSNCHNSKMAKSGFNFDTYESLTRASKKGKKGIVPGDPDGSRIVQTLEGKGRKMPPIKNAQPEKAEVKLLRDWITAGAKDDTVKSDPKDAPAKEGDKSGLSLAPRRRVSC